MNKLLFKRQKSPFSLVFQAKNRPFCRTFHLNQNQWENSLFPSEVHLTYEDFAAKRKKQVVLFLDFCKSGLVRLAQLSLFFPLF